MIESSGILFERLLAIMDRLRGPDGCPWDREQSRLSLKPYLIEEAYEVLEAIENDDAPALEEELGDLLFQVVFHARLASERAEFTMAHLLDRLTDKMIRRHPHVFGDAALTTAGEVARQWEAIKQREAEAKGFPRSVIDGVPRALPGLLRAQRLQEKAARVRFDWADAQAAWAKVEEELAETARALAEGERTRVQDELGDLFFSLVNVARLSSIDAEETLQHAIEKFRRRFLQMEQDLVTRGTPMSAASTEDMEAAWTAVKARERAGDVPGDDAVARA
jgi:tetrapyrrole methylase family protein / MazG family protein